MRKTKAESSNWPHQFRTRNSLIETGRTASKSNETAAKINDAPLSRR